MGRPSLRSLVQKELAAELEFVSDGGEGDHLPGSSPRVCHAEPVVSQFRQARLRGARTGAACAIERQPLVASEKTVDRALYVDLDRRGPPVVPNSDQLSSGAHKSDAALDRSDVFILIGPT